MCTTLQMKILLSENQKTHPRITQGQVIACGATLFDFVSTKSSLQSAVTLLSTDAGVSSQILIRLAFPPVPGLPFSQTARGLHTAFVLSPRPQEPIILILHLPGFHRPGFAVRP